MSKEQEAKNVRWGLTDLYDSMEDPQIERDKKRLTKTVDGFVDRYKGRISTLTPDEFYQMIRDYEFIIDLSHDIQVYAGLLHAINQEDENVNKFKQETSAFFTELMKKLNFVDVEWLDMDDKEAQKIIYSDEMAGYRYFLENLRKYKDHSLSETEENLLTTKSLTSKQAWTDFFDKVKASLRVRGGGTLEYGLSLMHDQNRNVRADAHIDITKELKANLTSFTTIFNTLLQDKWIEDELRGHSTWDESRHLDNEIDKGTVNDLVEAVTNSSDVVNDHYEVKREALGYDKLYDFDRYAPIPDANVSYSWEDAKEMVLETYKDFHPEAGNIVKKFFDNGWIDAEPRIGKSDGAFSHPGTVETHPYVLLNFNGKIGDVYTLAHELGHGIHQYLSADRGSLMRDTPLTTAETASVFGEMLIYERLLNEIPEEKRFNVILKKVDSILATVHRQTAMYKFEDRVHNERRTSGELTSDRIGQLWLETQQEMFSPAIEFTDGKERPNPFPKGIEYNDYSVWWTYIPHFIHVPGYVYAYAFGELLTFGLFDEYKNGENKKQFADNFMEMLRLGGSKHPRDVIMQTGVDFKEEGFWDKGINTIRSMVEEEKELNNKQVTK